MPIHLPRVALLALACIPFLAAACGGQQVDRIVYNAHIVTMDPGNPAARAMAIQGDRIVAVGSDEDVRGAYRGATEMDLAGQTVMPGINDAHVHLMSLGQSLMRLNVKDAATPGEVVERVRERVAQTPPGEWIVGWGWDEGAWAANYPDHAALSEASPDNPVYLHGLHGFAGWANAKALERAGVTAATRNPPDGEILRDRRGRPTGILTNRAQALVTSKIPPLSGEQMRAALELGGQECLKYGLTSMQDANVPADMLEAFRDVIADGRLKQRMSLMLAHDDALLETWFAKGPEIDPAHRLHVRNVKLFADGAMGSRGAAFFEPYTDAPNTSGQLRIPEDSLTALTERALEAGFQVTTHAIGDRANHVALNAYERALQAVPSATDARLRIEHAQVVAPDDIPRFARIGVLVGMQPNHCTSDMKWAEDRIGPERVRGAYAWRSISDTGARLSLSSDFPGETHNPFRGMYAALTRQDEQGNPADGWHPEQRLTREAVLRGYTVEAAYAEFEERDKGMLKPGMLADFIVLSHDILTMPVEAFLDVQVDQVFIGGERVYTRTKDEE